SSAFVFFNVGVDNAADIVLVFFAFLQKRIVFLVLVVALFLDILVVGHLGVRFFDHGHPGVFGFSLGRIGVFLVRGGLQHGFGRGHGGLGLFGFLDLFFVLLVLLGFGHGCLGGLRLRLARTALLVKRLRLEGELALRALDRTLVQV